MALSGVTEEIISKSWSDSLDWHQRMFALKRKYEKDGFMFQFLSFKKSKVMKTLFLIFKEYCKDLFYTLISIKNAKFCVSRYSPH